jgi:hypothetical protein
MFKYRSLFPKKSSGAIEKPSLEFIFRVGVNPSRCHEIRPMLEMLESEEEFLALINLFSKEKKLLCRNNASGTDYIIEALEKHVKKDIENGNPIRNFDKAIFNIFDLTEDRRTKIEAFELANRIGSPKLVRRIASCLKYKQIEKDNEIINNFFILTDKEDTPEVRAFLGLKAKPLLRWRQELLPFLREETSRDFNNFHSIVPGWEADRLFVIIKLLELPSDDLNSLIASDFKHKHPYYYLSLMTGLHALPQHYLDVLIAESKEEKNTKLSNFLENIKNTQYGNNTSLDQKSNSMTVGFDNKRVNDAPFDIMVSPANLKDESEHKSEHVLDQKKASLTSKKN